MIIGIYGIAGVYNLGCEAIIRGTYLNFKEIFPDAKWVYYSPNASEDSKILEDLAIEVRQTKKKMFFLKRCVNKSFDILGIKYQIPYDDYQDIINNVDMIISVGGDIYTIPSYLRQKTKYAYYNRLVDFGEKALNKGKKLIIYGASIGPFGDYEKAQKYYFNHLKRVNMIVCREKETINYLESFGISENVFFLPDPAFSLRGINELKLQNNRIIGINLSGLSLKETYGELSENSIRSLVGVLTKIIEKTGYDILLIPHVFANYELDNDYIILKKIEKEVNSKYKNKISISEKKTFLTIKEELRHCSVVVAARMHCAVNALSEGIPTILLAYSSKAFGMCQFVYGTTQWVYDIKQIENEKFYDLLEELIRNRDEISSDINSNLDHKLNKEQYRNAYEQIRKLS